MALEVGSIGVGIIGFGRIGAEHAGWMRATQTVRPAAVADPTPQRRAAAQAAGIDAFSDIAELLDAPGIDAILVSTPTAMHFEHASRALLDGKHVMVEKPMALDLAQSQQLIELARRQGLTLSVFHNRRWDADYLTVLAAVRGGALGKIINVESRITQWASCVGPATRDWRPGWRNEADFGGGGLYDWGSHLIDQLWRLMLPARPLRVFAQLRGNVWSSDCDDFARVLINFDDGAVGLVEINTTTTRPLPRWHIDGTLGSADSPQSPTYNINEWADLTFTSPDGQRRRLPDPHEALTEPQIWHQFAAAVRGQCPPAVPAVSVLPTMAILDAARESSRTGAAVTLTEASAK